MTIAEQVRNIIAHELSVRDDDVVPEADLINDLGADSLDCIELVMTLEERFNIDIPDEDAEKLVTVGKVIAYVEKVATKEA